jgi:hypothetical protein
MKRQELIQTITICASRFCAEVILFNGQNKYDINIHAENFLIPILNEVFGYQLENLNSSRNKNYPAVDLADFKNRVAFQVTSTSSFDKIKSTFEKFSKHELSNDFDILYFFILTSKQEKYSVAKINEVKPQNLSFDPLIHIIDLSGLLKRIEALSLDKLAILAKTFKHEFSDVQVESRQKFMNGYLNSEIESIFPNLVRISFPETIFQADLQIDKDSLTSKLNAKREQHNKTPIKKYSTEKLIIEALKENNIKSYDWIYWGDKLYTLRNLDNNKEPLTKILDRGTISSINCKEFYSIDDNHERVFKNLLRNTLIEFCNSRGMEWYDRRGIIRFANNPVLPKQKKVRWKHKNESTKTVIFEMMNKDGTHIVCYRSLAFRPTFENINDDWYLAISPTWSFTDNRGYRESKYQSSYMSGIKRMENNVSVYYYFRFLAYYLSYVDLLTHQGIITIYNPNPLEFTPKLNDSKWLPPKQPQKSSDSNDLQYSVDNEVNLSLFSE